MALPSPHAFSGSAAYPQRWRLTLTRSCYFSRHASALHVRLTPTLSLPLVLNAAESAAYGCVVRSVPACRAYALLGRSAGGPTPPPADALVLNAVLSALTRVFRPP